MLPASGGNQVRFYKAIFKVQPKKDHSNLSERKKGYEYIREKGPKANNLNQFVEWTDEKVNTPGCPIFGWQAGEVKESLRNYALGKTGAKTLESFPVFLKYVQQDFLREVWLPMLADHEIHSVCLFGKSRPGKSTVTKLSSFTISQYHIDMADDNEKRTMSILTTKT